MDAPLTAIIKVNLKKNPYNIAVGSGILKLSGVIIRKLNLGDAAYVITNPLIKNKFGRELQKTLKASGFSVRFKLVPDTEKSKSMGMASRVINDIALFDRKKKVFIIALGGGVIGDLSGFIAAIYRRGIPYVEIPTTLLAQVDSGIGGKTAVDLLRAKNLVGAFYQPKMVLSDVGLLKTLGLRQIRSGLAEVIKYAVIKDPAFFAYLEKNYEKILALKDTALIFAVRHCSGIKAEVVAQDEREEKGIRTILNFGHTLGHAIEAAAHYKGYTHGEAIALGMLLACDISGCLGLLGEATHRRIEDLIKKVGLPVKIQGVRLNDIIESYYRDKKFSGRKNKLVLLSGLGRTKIVEDIPLKIIKGAVKRRLKK